MAVNENQESIENKNPNEDQTENKIPDQNLSFSSSSPLISPLLPKPNLPSQPTKSPIDIDEDGFRIVQNKRRNKSDLKQKLFNPNQPNPHLRSDFPNKILSRITKPNPRNYFRPTSEARIPQRYNQPRL